MSNNNKYLADKDEEWIHDEFFVSSNILYNNIDQETNYLYLELMSQKMNTTPN